MLTITNMVKSSKDLIPFFNKTLNGNVTSENGETMLDFDNHIGKGVIRNMDFSHGVSLLSFNVKFKAETQFSFDNENFNPIAFILKGTLLSPAPIIIPEKNVVAVIFSWNVFDDNIENPRTAYIQAILDAHQNNL